MTVVEVSYAQAWNAEAHREYGPLSLDEARRKDSDGQPYVVIHRAPGRTVPLKVHLVSWGDHYVGQWTYDELGRVTEEADLRLLETDRLFLRRRVERRYSSPDEPDRARDGWRLTVDLLPDGRGTKVLDERGDSGGSFHTRADVPESERWRPRSEFGVRAARIPGGSSEREQGAYTARSTFGEEPEPQSLWRPPRPGRPGLALNELLRPGRRFTSECWGEMTVAEIRHIATLRVPSGRLVVADPRDQDAPREPDASGWKVLSGKIRRYYEEGDESAAEFVTDGCLRATDEETGGDLVSFYTEGDGTWPVWLGRSATGELVAVTVITSWLMDLRPV